MNKKGVELSMNVIIISILVILVLVVLTFFFLGGTSTLFQKIQNIGLDNLDTAKSDCISKCQLAQSLDIKSESSYCRTTYNTDSNGDKIADEKHHCWASDINIACPGVQDLCTQDAVEQIEQNV